MTKTRLLVAAAAVLALLTGLPLQAEEADSPGTAYTRNLSFVGDRSVQLVEAIPGESFDWRPMEGVRSVSEAAMHMASANYFFAGRMGVEAPEGLDVRSMDKITDKAEVVAALEASLEHLSKAFLSVEDPKAETDIYGHPGTVEDLMMIAIGHVHEHFGQLIAYARSNQVTPPWSQSDG